MLHKDSTTFVVFYIGLGDQFDDDRRRIPSAERDSASAKRWSWITHLRLAGRDDHPGEVAQDRSGPPFRAAVAKEADR
jgi:hypothetical protein